MSETSADEHDADTEAVFKDVVTVSNRRARLLAEVKDVIDDLDHDPLGSSTTDQKLAELQVALGQPEVTEARKARGRLRAYLLSRMRETQA